MSFQRRLQIEHLLLQKYFRGFRVQGLDDGRDPGAIGRLRTNSGRSYTIWVPLGDFPDGPPDMYVVAPVLYDHDGGRLSSIGTSYTMHVLSPDAHGHVQICHYNDRYWRPEVTLYKVVMKGRLWLEAYERHLATGQPIDDFLCHMD